MALGGRGECFVFWDFLIRDLSVGGSGSGLVCGSSLIAFARAGNKSSKCLIGFGLLASWCLNSVYLLYLLLLYNEGLLQRQHDALFYQ